MVCFSRTDGKAQIYISSDCLWTVFEKNWMMYQGPGLGKTVNEVGKDSWMQCKWRKSFKPILEQEYDDPDSHRSNSNHDVLEANWHNVDSLWCRSILCNFFRKLQGRAEKIQPTITSCCEDMCPLHNIEKGIQRECGCSSFDALGDEKKR
jgi:hypothetical protein